ncbi:alpha/beta hydrolase [Nocardia wallacei]|uniref:alpha/beta hydrolase n=1 Tax=Nocardia wallacei TaxID=480035 RepID=UPI0024552D96|nr:alpha/beta hydrolase [Nocardia wallacei]
MARRTTRGFGRSCAYSLGRTGALAAVLLLAVTACGLLPVVRPPDFYPAELARFYTQTPHWGSCAQMNEPQYELSPEARCARILAPLDYDHPTGRTVELAISRKPATGPRVGALLLNPGGPGSRGLSLADSVDGTRLAHGFDRIGFDPRGVGASLPRVSCGDPRDYFDPFAPRFDTSPEGIAAHEQMNRNQATQCEKHSGAELLAHIGTREVVRDMDIIRAVAGDRRMNYIGYSYGTQLGWAYAERYPHRVRAMVLDGAVAPHENTYTRTLNQESAFQKAFDSFAMECARRQDCPLGADPEQAPLRLRELSVPLQTEPLRSQRDPSQELFYTDVLNRTSVALYKSESWDGLIAALRALRDRNPDPMLELADHLGSDPTPEQVADDDAYTAITCVDQPPITDRAENDRLDVEVRRAAPFEDDGRGTGHAPLDVCAFWPVPPTGHPHTLDIANLPTVLVVSTTYDPATPHRAGIDLAQQLRARLITYQGTRHTIALLDKSQCVDQRVIDYLMTLRLPAQDVVC